MYPASDSTRRLRRTSTPLSAANGTNIHTWGVRDITVAFSTDLKTTHTFHLADVTTPILGADFFIANNIAIDMPGRRLIHMQNTTATPLCHTPLVSSVMGLSLQPSTRFSDLLQQFPQVLTPQFDTADSRHGIEMHIVTTGPPVHSRPRRLDNNKFQHAREEFRRMEQLGIVRPSDSPWASPLHMTPKPSKLPPSEPSDNR